MDASSLLAQLDIERQFLSEGCIRETSPHIVRDIRSDGAVCIAYSRLTDGNADEVIGAEAARCRLHGAATEWKAFSHDGPDDLIELLRRHRFIPGPMEAVLVLDLGRRPAWMDEPSPFRTVRVSSFEDVEVYKSVAEASLAKPYDFTAGQLREEIATGSTHHLAYIAYADGEAASIGRLYTHPESVFGGLYGGATVAAFRGRGLYRALVAARARDAAQFGAKFLYVEALPTSRPILERLGFRCIGATWPCEFTP